MVRGLTLLNISSQTLILSHLEQTFGLDLEVRARADRKRVPLVITGILTYLDHRMYPRLLYYMNAPNSVTRRLPRS